MSRSRRKSPVIGNCATSRTSEKDDKRIWHRAYRRKVRGAVKKNAEIMPDKNDVSSPWVMNKDGKHRFNPKKWPKSMRK